MLGDKAWHMGGFVESRVMGPDLWKQSEMPQGIASSPSLTLPTACREAAWLPGAAAQHTPVLYTGFRNWTVSL